MSESSVAHPRVNLETNQGRIVLELWPEAAPVAVENFLTYVREGFYDGLIFHRVVPGFVAQAGGFEPGMVYRQPSQPPIQNEAANGQKNRRGAVAMARAFPINSAAAQFFINLSDNPNLDHHGSDPQSYGYTVFGQVVEGMGVVDSMAQAPRETRGQHRDVPVEDVVIQRVRIAGEEA